MIQNACCSQVGITADIQLGGNFLVTSSCVSTFHCPSTKSTNAIENKHGTKKIRTNTLRIWQRGVVTQWVRSVHSQVQAVKYVAIKGRLCHILFLLTLYRQQIVLKQPDIFTSSLAKKQNQSLRTPRILKRWFHNFHWPSRTAKNPRMPVVLASDRQTPR